MKAGDGSRSCLWLRLLMPKRRAWSGEGHGVKEISRWYCWCWVDFLFGLFVALASDCPNELSKYRIVSLGLTLFDHAVIGTGILNVAMG